MSYNVRRGPAMANSKARIGFLTLPPELRNRIYELVLAQKDTILDRVEDCPMGSFAIGRSSWYPVAELQGQPPLTKAWRTIRSGTLEVYYGCNKFCCVASGSAFAAVAMALRAGTGSALRAIGKKNASLVKVFEVKIEQDAFDFDLGLDATHRHLASHTSKISELLMDYVKQQDILLPRGTKLLAGEGVDLSTFDIDDPWQTRVSWKPLLLLEREDGTRREGSA